MGSRIAFVGEAWDQEDEQAGRAFSGPSGRMLAALCSQVGIDFRSAYKTSVMNMRPPQGANIESFCGPKTEGIPDLPYYMRGKYVRAEYAPELARLRRELEIEAPNVVVACGPLAVWALLETSGGIKQYRGAPAQSPWGFKVLPTYHPSSVRKENKLRPILIADLAKVASEAEFPEVRRPSRKIWIDPTLEDIDIFIRDFILPNEFLSIDIETMAESITCIGFAPTISEAIVIPFWDATKPDGNYWPTLTEELAAWDKVRYILSLPKKGVFQNGMYDLSFMWRTMGLTVPHAAHDTMLLHHAMQPEMEKGLGMLATLYTQEASWKYMRKAGETASKKED